VQLGVRVGGNGLDVPRDISRLDLILHFTPSTGETWKRWKTDLGPSPGGDRGALMYTFVSWAVLCVRDSFLV
jgi:hypothetical protein